MACAVCRLAKALRTASRSDERSRRSRSNASNRRWSSRISSITSPCVGRPRSIVVSLTDGWYPTEGGLAIHGGAGTPRLASMAGERSTRSALVLVVAVTVVLSVGLSLLHLPSAVLFAAL